MRIAVVPHYNVIVNAATVLQRITLFLFKNLVLQIEVFNNRYSLKI